MNSLMDRYTASVSRLSTLQRLACLVGVVSVVAALAAPVAYLRHAMLGIQVVLLSAGVALLGSAIATVMGSFRRGTPSAVAWILAGDAVAMALPLATIALVVRQGGAAAEAGAGLWGVLFFLTALVTKTVLVAPLAQQAKVSAPATVTKVGA